MKKPSKRVLTKLLNHMLEKRKDCSAMWARREAFLCWSACGLWRAGRISYDEMNALRYYIQRQLAPHPTLEDWLKHRGVRPVNDSLPASYTKVNNHRIKWVRRMIKELE